MRVLCLFWVLVISPIYLRAQDFSLDASFLPIRKGDKWGAIDTLGKIILPLQYDSLRFEEATRTIYAVQNGKRGIFDEAGKELLPVRFTSVQRFFQIGWQVSEERKNRFGIWSRQGKEILPTEYEKLTTPLNAPNLIFLTKDGDLGITDTIGRFVLPCAYNSIKVIEKDSLTFFQTEKRNKYGLFTEKGQEVLPTEYDTLGLLNVQYCIVGNRNKLGIYSFAQKQMVLPTQFRKARILKGSNQTYYFLTQQDKQTQVWDLAGKPLIRAGEYDDVVFDSVGVFRTFQAGLRGIASASGELPPTFDEIMPFVGNLAVVRKGDSLGLINQAGEILLAPSLQVFEVRGNTVRRQLDATKTEVLKLNQAGKLIERDTYTNLKSVKIKRDGEREINSTDYNFNTARVDTARITNNAITDSTFFQTQIADWRYDVLKKHWTATKNGKKVYPEMFTNLVRYPESGVFIAKFTKRYQRHETSFFFNLQTGKKLFEGANSREDDLEILEAFSRNKYVVFDGYYINREGKIINRMKVYNPQRKDSVIAKIYAQKFVRGFSLFYVAYVGRGLVNEDVSIIIPPLYKNIQLKYGDCWSLENNGLLGLADSLGKIIIPVKYEIIGLAKSDRRLFILQNRTNKFNLVLSSYGVLMDWSDSVRYMSNGMIVFKQDKYWQFTNGSSKSREYEKLQDFSNERAWAIRKKQKKWVLISKSGRYWRTQGSIDTVQSFVGRFAIAGKNGKFGLMNRYARWFIKPQYTRIERIGETSFMACYQAKDQKYYLLNRDGKLITPRGCDKFQVHNALYLTIENEGNTVFLTYGGNVLPTLPKIKILPTRPQPEPKITQQHLPYDTIEPERQGLTRVMVKKCYAIADASGKILIEDLQEPFTKIVYAGKGIFYITQANNEGYWHTERGWLWQRY